MVWICSELHVNGRIPIRRGTAALADGELAGNHKAEVFGQTAWAMGVRRSEKGSEVEKTCLTASCLDTLSSSRLIPQQHS